MPYVPTHPGLPSLLVAIGERVQAQPWTDAWMRGDRYGSINRTGRKYVYVKMDRSGRIRRFRAADLIFGVR